MQNHMDTYMGLVTYRCFTSGQWEAKVIAPSLPLATATVLQHVRQYLLIPNTNVLGIEAIDLVKVANPNPEYRCDFSLQYYPQNWEL